MAGECAFFSEVFDDCLMEYTSAMKSSRSAVEYRRSIRLICEFTKKDFLDIDVDDASSFFHYMKVRVANGTMKKSTINVRKACYNRVATYIEEKHPELEYKNVFLHISSQRGVTGDIAPSRIPSISDIDLILSNAPSSMYYLIFAMAFRIALSASDIVGLRLCHIQEVDGGLCIHYPPKDDFSEDRVVVLPPDIENLMMKHLSEMTFKDNAGHLFYNKHRNPLTVRNLDAAVSKAVKASGISDNYTLRDLRSRGILEMLNATVKVKGDVSHVGAYAGIKDLRLNSYVSASSMIGKCPADLVNFQLKTYPTTTDNP